ncbi:hypothetical protein RZO55_07595 [Clostridium boliviensis]|uniref:Uncharacterized protein n=1 Tax=Clostridium boliviensis TaxID=318465 RepID=A0ABU4GIK6_9CLOT|nr:hypothetical protein [Clostridium boliviensis]MDW2797438.1 hypothetical protein [Clostridium boliviensis]
MTSKEIIKEIIGPVLRPIGFVSGENIDSCWFVRKFKNSKGETARQVVEFNSKVWEKKLFMVIHCYSGRNSSYQTSDFVPDSRDEGITYSSIREYRQAVKTYAEILNVYGPDFFEKIAQPPVDNDYFREEDDFRLFEKHELLAKKFATEHHLDLSEITTEDAVNIIKKMILEKQGESFENCRDLILELSAFYGCVLKKRHRCIWVMHNCRTHFTCTLDSSSKTIPSRYVHNDIHVAWKNGVDRLDSLII